MRKFLRLLCVLCFIQISVQSQVLWFAGSGNTTMVTDMVKCSDTTFSVYVYNSTAAPLNNCIVDIQLPNGLTYIAGSVLETTSGSPLKNVVEQNISNLSRPYFSMSNIPVGQSVAFTYRLHANCNGSSASQSIPITLTHATGTSSPSGLSTININAAAINIVNGSNASVTQNIGTSYTQSITLRNAGLGYIDGTKTNIITRVLLDTTTCLQISNPNIGTLHGDTLLIPSSAFTSIGDGDLLWENNEDLQISYTVTIACCTNLSRTIRAQWGCDNTACATSSSFTSNVAITNAVPNVSVIGTSYDTWCANTWSTRTFRFVNTGTGPAKDFQFNLNVDYNANAISTNSIFKAIDSSSVQYKIGANGIYSNMPHANTTANNSYISCKPLGSVKAVNQLYLPIINAGDTVYVTFQEWQANQTCVESSTVCGTKTWGQAMISSASYKNQCGTTNYTIATQTIESGLNMNLQGASQVTSPTDVFSGQNFNVTFSLDQFSLYGVTSALQQKSRLGIYMKIPTGFTVNSSNNFLLTLPGSSSTISSVKGEVINDTLFVEYPAGSSMFGRMLNINMTFNCVAGVQSPSNLAAGLYARIDTVTCVSTANKVLTACLSNLVTPHCGTCTEGGLTPVYYELKRINYGLPDNNIDGLADGSGSIDLSKIALKNVMNADTFQMYWASYVVPNTANPSLTWNHAYAVSNMSAINSTGTNFDALQATVVVKRANGTVLPACTISTVDSNNKFIWNLTPCIGGILSAGDSVFITSTFRVIKAINSLGVGGLQDVYKIVPTNIMYSSIGANPSMTTIQGAVNNAYSCDNWTDYLQIINVYATQYFTNNIATITGCNSVTVGYNGYYSVGPCCSNYGNERFFPYEYRAIGYYDTVLVRIPKGFRLVNNQVQFVNNYTNGFTSTGSQSVYITPVAIPMADGSTVYRVYVGGLYENGTLKISSGGSNFQCLFTLVGSCDVASGASQPLKGNIWFKGASSAFSEGGLGAIDYIETPPAPYNGLGYTFSTITYNPPVLNNVGGGTVSVNRDTISNLFSIQNQSNNAPSNNTWLYIIPLQNSGTVDSVKIGNTKITANAQGYYNMGTVAAAATTNYRVFFNTSNCNKQQFLLYTGYDCVGIPTATFNAATATCSPPDTFTVLHNPVGTDASLTVNWTGAGNKVDFCSNFSVDLTMNATQLGDVAVLSNDWVIPFGYTLQIADTKIEYPAGSGMRTPGNLSALSVNGNLLHVNLNSLDNTLANGISGSYQTTNKTLKLRLAFSLGCQAASGDAVQVAFNAVSACGDTLDQINKYSPTIHFSQVTLPNYASQPYGFADTIKNCDATSHTLQVILPFTVISGTTSANDSIYVTLPPGVDFSSYNPSASGQAHQPLVQPNGPVQVGNGLERYSWPMTGGLATADSIKFTVNYQFDPTEFSGCNQLLKDFVISTGGNSTITCGTSVCTVSSLNGRGNVPLLFMLPSLSMAINQSSCVQNGTQTAINFDLNICNTGGHISTGTNTTIALYCDANQNGMYDAGTDVWIKDFTTTQGMPSGQCITLQGLQAIYNQATCANGYYLAVIKRQHNAQYQCLCDSIYSQNWNCSPILCSAFAGTDKTITCSTTQVVLGTSPMSGASYLWSPATGLSDIHVAQPVANPTVTTTYVLTVNGLCTDTVIVTVDKTLPIADAGLSKNIDCNTISTQIGTVSVLGNTYNWLPSSGLSSTTIAQPTANPTVTTIYTVTVTGTNGCTSTSTVLVNVNQTPPVADAGQDKTINCTTTQVNIGSATVSGVTYSWSPTSGLSASNIADPIASPSVTTQYTVTATRSNGCTATDVVLVSVNTTAPIADAGINSTIDCITTSASIGTTAITGNTYSWSPTTGLSASQSATPLASPMLTTTYTITVTGTNGCTATDFVTVTVNQSLPITNAGQDKSLNCTTTFTTIGTAFIASNGYSWSPATGLSDTHIAQPIASPTATTTYTVTVTGLNGCTNTDIVTVDVNTLLPQADAGLNQIVNCSTTAVTIGTTGIVGNSYSWSPAAGLSATNIAQPIASPTVTTTYTVTVTGFNGCTATDVVQVDVNTVLPVANAGSDKTLNCSITSAMIGTSGTLGNTYSWSPATGLSATNIAQPIASPLTNTTYTVTVTGSNGCTQTSSVIVLIDNTPPLADAGLSQTITCQTVSTTIGTPGTLGNTYSWSPTTGLSATNIAQPIASPTVNTTYTVTVTGLNGCTATDIILVDVNTTLPIVNAGTNTSLNCISTQTIIGSSATVGNSYVWQPTVGLSAANIAQPVATPNITTTYTVTVTNAINGCSATDAVTVVVDKQIPVADAGVNQTLNCLNTAVSVGSLPISGNVYSWQPVIGLSQSAVAQPVATPPATTIYTLTVTGSNGCTATSTATVNVYIAPPIADAGNQLQLNCIHTQDLIGTSAVVGNTYSWLPATNISNTQIAQPTVQPTVSTIYTVTVTGSNGCTQTSSVMVDVDTAIPIVDAGQQVILNCSLTSATIGTPAISGNTYQWQPITSLSNANIASPIVQATSQTTYSLTVTGSNGCQATDTVVVSIDNQIPQVTIMGDTSVCKNSTNTITASGGMLYVWSNGDHTASTNIGAGTYTVTVTGTNGCTNTATVQMNTVEAYAGNYVWLDSNANGLFDEQAIAGINGVWVELWDANTVTKIDDVQTTNDTLGNPGYYRFTICNAGNYTIKFPVNLSANLQLTQTSILTNTDLNSDADKLTGFTPTFYINPLGTPIQQQNLTLDAGYFALASLGDYVWHDMNRNGMQDAQEVGVAGITVTLYNQSNIAISSTITDAYGKYKFSNLLPGNYAVSCTLPQNYIFTNYTATSTSDAINSDIDTLTGKSDFITLVSGENQTHLDAGIYYALPMNATLGNYIWNDINEDGIQQSNEVGISGVSISLYTQSGNMVASTISDVNGMYTFYDVEPGNYRVQITPPVGMVFSPMQGVITDELNSDIQPGSGSSLICTVVAGDHITYVDAGLHLQTSQTASIGDWVWNDINKNGLQDIGEPGMPGVHIQLLAADAITVLQTTISDAYGNYIFNELPTGTYYIAVSSFPSGYQLVAINQSDTTRNSNIAPSSAVSEAIHLIAGSHNMTIDIGLQHQLADLNSIGNWVWYDQNANGLQDNQEYGVSGIQVYLFDASMQVMKQTATDKSGFYLFTDLPDGNYYVKFAGLPETYIWTNPSLSTDSTVDSNPDKSSGISGMITVSGGEYNQSIDAGLVKGNIKSGTASIGDWVWYDLNQDGLQQVNEPGVADVAVYLYAADGSTLMQSTITNALGEYIFTNLAAGTYHVGFDNIPLGHTVTQFNADGLGLNGEVNSDLILGQSQTASIVVTTGEDKLSIDVGIVPPAGTAGLGDKVWNDVNQNGLQDVNEPGVQGVTVELMGVNGQVWQSTTTNSAGNYQFIGLLPGNYLVHFTNLPQGYQLTTIDANGTGLIGDINSDVNPLTATTALIQLTAGEFNANIDAGIWSATTAALGDYIWLDENKDGMQQSNEHGIGGVLVTLYQFNGLAVASTVTKANGSYIFSNVLPGQYYIACTNLPTTLSYTIQENDTNSLIGSNIHPQTGLSTMFTLTAGAYNPGIDIGLITPNTGTIGNYVWLDGNENGWQDASEQGIAGVIVTLYAADGITSLATAVTDGNGLYSFTNLPDASYVVGFSSLPVGTTRTTIVGSLQDALNSDINSQNKTDLITIVSGSTNLNVDAGFYIGIPLSASDFKATTAYFKDAAHTVVNWYTNNEVNTEKFAIERSIDGKTFNAVMHTPASNSTAGTTHYSITDDIAQWTDQNVIYYRVALIDVDGHQTYSNVISAKRNAGNPTITIYPVPFNNALLVDYIAEENSYVDITLFDMKGTVVRKISVDVNKGFNTLQLTSLSDLPQGSYIVNIHDLNLNKHWKQNIVK